MMVAQGSDVLWISQVVFVIFLGFVVPGSSESGMYLFEVTNFSCGTES